MQPLYTEAEFKTAKSRQLLPLRCLHCTQTFFRPKNYIQISIHPNRVETGDFCSSQCRTDSSKTLKLVICEQCSVSFQKHPCDIKKTKHHFCTSSCSASWNNTHKTKGTRVSKLEHWLQEQLPTLYPGLEFHFNRTDAITGELDIFIPSLKLAFELNGIFHYEPIYGPEKLAKMQTNDARKAQACLERNIELCILDVSSIKNFKEHRALKFLDIIKTIINSKLSGSSP
jgi:hypothetical protein